MTAERNVEKNLACAEDLQFGEGQIQQTRGGGNFNMSKIRGFWPVNSQEEFDAIDPLQFPKVATVLPDEVDPTKLVLTFHAYVNDTWVALGTTGQSTSGIVFKSTVFQRASSKPALPTAGDFDNPVPPGWSDGIPAGELTLWATTRIFSSDGNPPQQAVWTAVQQMTDTETTDYEWSSVLVNPGDPTNNPDNWSDTPDVNTIWQAIRKKTNGVFGPWEVIRIKGEDGEDGTDANDSFKSTIFLRNDTQPDTPTGGSYNAPVAQGWFDGVPAGEAILWASTRIFTRNGLAPQQAAWTTPVQMTDTETTDYEWSSVENNPGDPTNNPANWSDTPDTSTIWQAIRKKTNGVFGAWTIIRVRGEDGTDGANVRYGGWFNISSPTGDWDDALAASACPGGQPVEDDVVTIWKATDVTVSNTKRYNGTSWVAPGLVIHGDILAAGTVRGDRFVAGTEIISPVITGGVIDGGVWQSIGPNVMIVYSATPFGPDNLVEWKGNKIVDAGGQPILNSLTKANALVWTDENGAGYFGGGLSAGILRSAANNTTKIAYPVGEAIVEIGPFTTNGATKNVIINYAYTGSDFQSPGTCPVNPTTATLSWRLERKIGAGSWTTQLTGTFVGNFNCVEENADAISSENNSGSTTYIDSDATVDDFSYRLVVTAYDRFMALSNVDSQSISLSSTEE